MTSANGHKLQGHGAFFCDLLREKARRSGMEDDSEFKDYGLITVWLVWWSSKLEGTTVGSFRMVRHVGAPPVRSGVLQYGLQVMYAVVRITVRIIDKPPPHFTFVNPTARSISHFHHLDNIHQHSAGYPSFISPLIFLST